MPLVFEVRDLWPEAPIQMGALTDPRIQRWARSLEQNAYRRARRVIALSPGIRDGVISAGVAPEKVELVPNGADLDLFRPSEPPDPDHFVVSYFGTMGEANDLTAAIEAARLLPDMPFVLMGDGKRRPELERAAPPNVEFPGPAPGKEQVAALAARSGACLTFFKDVPVLATNSPNKLFDTFAAGRPAIVNMDGWMRRLVEDNDAGMYVRAGDAQDLAQKLAWLRAHPEEVERMGRNARALAEREFDRDKLAAACSTARGGGALTALSYCVVNTNGRDWLMACLAAIDRTHPPGVSYEVLVLDNASEDGSADAVRDAHPAARLIALDRRGGKAENDSRLLQEARGEHCLLLNEDTELREGATRALLDALDGDPRAGAAGAQLLTSDGEPTACAWRLPNAGWALAGALFMHDSYAVQSRGNSVRRSAGCSPAR